VCAKNRDARVRLRVGDVGDVQTQKPLQNLLSKAYINYTHRMKLNGMELPERTLKELANHQRHTLEVAQRSYRKINLAEDDDAPIVLPTKPEKPRACRLWSRSHHGAYR